jgi:hypothetical protein
MTDGGQPVNRVGRSIVLEQAIQDLACERRLFPTLQPQTAHIQICGKFRWGLLPASRSRVAPLAGVPKIQKPGKEATRA